MQEITREQLKAKLDRGDNFHLVMTMKKRQFNMAHIPGSTWADLQHTRPEIAPTAEIVVYCSAPQCIASRAAYEWLTTHGYTNVYHYSGGLADWAAAGYPIATGANA